MTDVTSRSLEDRIERLEDLRAIEQLKYQYAAYCDDRYDPDGIAALFVENGRWIVDGEGAKLNGRAEIHAHFTQLADRIPWALHHIIAPRIELSEDGGSAVGQFYLFCMCTIEKNDDSGEFDAVVLTNGYTDRFVKVDGRWYFEELLGKAHQVSNWDQGWVKQRFRP